MKEWIWIEDRDALTIHGRLLAIHGGAPGLRDLSLLESALARPQQHHAYVDPPPDVCDLAAIYTASVVRNHPFVDGNKRTGFVVGILFLEMNGGRFIAEEAAATQAMLALAENRISESEYAAFLRENTHRPKR